VLSDKDRGGGKTQRRNIHETNEADHGYTFHFNNNQKTERRKEMKKMFVLILGMMFLASCATTAPPKTGFLGEYYKNLAPARKAEWPSCAG